MRFFGMCFIFWMLLYGYWNIWISHFIIIFIAINGQNHKKYYSLITQVKEKVNPEESTEPPSQRELHHPDIVILISLKDKATLKELSEPLSMIQEEEPLSWKSISEILTDTNTEPNTF